MADEEWPVGEMAGHMLEMQARLLATERLLIATLAELAAATPDPLKTLDRIRSTAGGVKNALPDPIQQAMERSLGKCEAAIIAFQHQRKGVGPGG